MSCSIRFVIAWCKSQSDCYFKFLPAISLFFPLFHFFAHETTNQSDLRNNAKHVIIAYILSLKYIVFSFGLLLRFCSNSTYQFDQDTFFFHNSGICSIFSFTVQLFHLHNIECRILFTVDRIRHSIADIEPDVLFQLIIWVLFYFILYLKMTIFTGGFLQLNFSDCQSR